MTSSALGLIETTGYVGAIVGADAAVKGANVTIKGMTFVGAGIVTVFFSGDVGAVQEAVAIGEVQAKKVGYFRASHVIPRASHHILSSLLKDTKLEKKVLKEEAVNQNPSKEKYLKEKPLKEKNLEVKTLEEDAPKQIVSEEIKAEISKEEPLEEPSKEELLEEPVEEKNFSDISKTSVKTKEELQAMKVVKLRNLARKLDGFTIEKSKIKYANKKELVQAILDYYERNTKV